MVTQWLFKHFTGDIWTYLLYQYNLPRKNLVYKYIQLYYTWQEINEILHWFYIVSAKENFADLGIDVLHVLGNIYCTLWYMNVAFNNLVRLL